MNHRFLSLSKKENFLLWVVFFCYSICAALIVQRLVLPLFPSLHAGGGLLFNDAVYFNSLAVDISAKIRLHGWSSWQPLHVSGNVAVLSAVYAIFDPNPAWIIPVNAALHALSGLLVFLIARELSDNQPIGVYAGMIGAGLFVVFPSALNWYSQLHKDGYSIAGILLILLAWLKVARNSSRGRGWIALLFIYLTGVVMIASVRPYLLEILLPATLGAYLVTAIVALARRQRGGKMVPLVLFLLIGSFILFGSIKFFKETRGADVVSIQSGYSFTNWRSNDWRWQNTAWLPDVIDKYIGTAAGTRVAQIGYGLSVASQSMIDPDIKPQNISELVRFMPRAFQVAIFAPFPLSWFTNKSMTHLVASAEMLIFYLFIPGILLLLRYNRNQAVILSLYFSCFFLLALGFTTSNVGTLYRMRYAYFFVLLLLGVTGWLTWLDKAGWLEKFVKLFMPPDRPKQSVATTIDVTDPLSLRKEAVNAGFWVMVLTFLCFVGFFIRDLLMARIFGLGTQLDGFFIALLIPMFVVTVLYMPLGAAFIPIYLDAKERLLPDAVQHLVSDISFWTGVSLLTICPILFVSGPLILSFFHPGAPSADMDNYIVLFHLALPILLFSGMVIIGNSLLNADGRAILSSGIQLIVPLTAILALVLLGSRYGIASVMYGMLAGQLLNLFVVQFFLASKKVWILSRPTFNFRKEISRLLKQYGHLALSALFASLVIPVGTLLAMSLPGGVSAFNLGTKVMLFVTGLAGAAISAVLLPYFSSMISKNQIVAVQRELSFFLLMTTFISIPVSVGLFLWSDPVIRFIFEGGSFDSRATAQVSRVMRYSIVQLPFFACITVLLKFATAARRVMVISVATFIGLLVNIGAGYLLMEYMGVGGIALGASLSVIVSSVLLLLFHARNGYIGGLDTVIMLMSWLLFMTLLICIHFHSVPSIYATMSACAVLVGGYAMSLRSDKVEMSS